VLTVSIIRVVMMEAASTSETLVSFYNATWYNIPEDTHLSVSSDITFLLIS
jgi:hypothetical protein